MMNDVVYVMANSKLAKKKQSKTAKEFNIDDMESDDEWMMEAMCDEDEGNGVLDVDNLDFETPNEEEGNQDDLETLGVNVVEGNEDGVEFGADYRDLNLDDLLS